MFKRVLLAACALLLFCQGLYATTVTGTVLDLSGTPLSGPDARVRFTLQNYDSNVPKVSGTAMISGPGGYFFEFEPNVSAAISGTIYGNDVITPAGTYYRVCIFGGGRQLRCADYLITGATFNLNSAAPLTTVPVVLPPTGDDTYLRLDGGNKPSGNIVPNAASGQTLGASGARWDIYAGTLVVASTTLVSNLNAERVADTQCVRDRLDWAPNLRQRV